MDKGELKKIVEETNRKLNEGIPTMTSAQQMMAKKAERTNRQQFGSKGKFAPVANKLSGLAQKTNQSETQVAQQALALAKKKDAEAKKAEQGNPQQQPQQGNPQQGNFKPQNKFPQK